MKRGTKNTRTQAKDERPRETSRRGTRARAVERAERLLLRRASPRLLMSLLLLLTGGAGFLCSYALLRAGLSTMWLRYPVAILSAYCVFLLLLRLWLGAQGRRRDSRSDLDPSVLDFVPGGGAAGGGDAQGFSFGGAGDFDGGGAGGEWVRLGDAGPADADPSPGVPSPSLTSVGLTSPNVSSAGLAGGGGGSGGTTSGGGLLDSLNIDLDLDGEGCAVLLALAALAAAAVAGLAVSVYVVYAAPALLAEILVDGLLVAGLYKRMKRVERRHWLRAAVRKTCLPVALTVASFSLAGYAMQRAVPRARTVGEFWRYVTSE